MSAAAGWYPDPTGAPGGRWWDGAQWTAHTLAPPVAPRPVDVPPRPVDVPTNTVWIWLAIAASTLPLASLLFLDPSGYISATMRAVAAMPSVRGMRTSMRGAVTRPPGSRVAAAPTADAPCTRHRPRSAGPASRVPPTWSARSRRPWMP